MNYAQLSKGLSTASGAAPVVLGDITDMYKAYNPVFTGNPYQNFNVGADYNSLLRQTPDYMTNDIQSVGAGQMFLNSQKNALEGASAFSSLGPWGMLGGAIGGTLMSIGTDLGNNLVGKQRQQRKVDFFNRNLDMRYNSALQSSLDLATEQQQRNRVIKPFAGGGDLTSQAPNEYNEFNAGGSHEQNPFGGIPQGLGANGQPNMVEEGEVKFGDYIYSDRIALADNIRDQFQIPEKYSRKSFADIAKGLQEESKERPNDPISKKGLEAMMQRLRDAQEYQKLEEAAAENGLSIEEYLTMMQQQPQNNFAYGGPVDPPKNIIEVAREQAIADEKARQASAQPLVFDPNLFPQQVQAVTPLDAVNTKQRSASIPKPQKQQSISQQPTTPSVNLVPIEQLIAEQQTYPTAIQDGTYTTQSKGYTPEQITQITAQDFLIDFAQKYQTSLEMFQQELAELNPQQRALVESIGYDKIMEARQYFTDNASGSITKGKDYNAIQRLWRDYTSTAAGQQLVKMIESQPLQMMAGALNPTAMLGTMGVNWANEYGQGADASEVAKTIGKDLAFMGAAGLVMNGKAIVSNLNQMGFMKNPFKPRNFKVSENSLTRGIGNEAGLEDLVTSGIVRGNPRGRLLSPRDISKYSKSPVWKNFKEAYPEAAEELVSNSLSEKNYNIVKQVFTNNKIYPTNSNSVLNKTSRLDKFSEEFPTYEQYKLQDKTKNWFPDNSNMESPSAFWFNNGQLPAKSNYPSKYFVKLKNSNMYEPYIPEGNFHPTTKQPVKFADPNVEIYRTVIKNGKTSYQLVPKAEVLNMFPQQNVSTTTFKPNINPNNNLIAPSNIKYMPFGKTSLPYKNNLFSKIVTFGVPATVGGYMFNEAISIPGDIKAQKEFETEQFLQNNINMLNDYGSNFYYFFDKNTPEAQQMSDSLLNDMRGLKDLYQIHYNDLNEVTKQVLDATGIIPLKQTKQQ